MGKKISANTTSSARAEAKFKLYHPVLAECGFRRNDRPDDASTDDKPKRFYDATMEISEEKDDKVKVAICEFAAGQKIKETKILEIYATYFVGLECADLKSGDEKRSALHQLVGASAWPMFRDLFIHIGSQSGEELPLLPNSPTLRWIAEKQ